MSQIQIQFKAKKQEKHSLSNLRLINNKAIKQKKKVTTIELIF
jgi:hypothetical protein